MPGRWQGWDLNLGLFESEGHALCLEQQCCFRSQASLGTLRNVAWVYEFTGQFTSLPRFIKGDEYYSDGDGDKDNNAVLTVCPG